MIAPTSPPSLPSLKAKLLLGILALLVSLILMEVLVRIFIPHPRYLDPIQPDPQVGFIPMPNLDERATNMFGEFDTRIMTNAEGFRDRREFFLASIWLHA